MVFYCVINCYCLWFSRQTQCVSVPPATGAGCGCAGEGQRGNLATAHGGPGHSKSVSFGGDPSRLFKRVHYRLVNASAEGETLLTALNSLCTQSPFSHKHTHTPKDTTLPFSSPSCFPSTCVCFSWDVCCLRRCVFACTWHTHLYFGLLLMNFMGLAFTESITISQSLPVSCIDLCALGLNVGFCARMCVHVCV